MNRCVRNVSFPQCPPEDDDFEFVFPCETSNRRVQCRSDKVDTEMYLQCLRNEICQLEQRRDCLTKSKANCCDDKQTCVVEINGKTYELSTADQTKGKCCQSKGKRDNPPCAITIKPTQEETNPCPQVPVVLVGVSDSSNPLSDVEATKKALVQEVQNLTSYTIPQYDNLIQRIIDLLVQVVGIESCGSKKVQCRKEQMMKELSEMIISVKDKKAQQQKLDALQKDFNDKQALLQNQLNAVRNDYASQQAQLQNQLNDLNNKLLNCCKPAPPPPPPPLAQPECVPVVVPFRC